MVCLKRKREKVARNVHVGVNREERQFFELTNKKCHLNFLPGKWEKVVLRNRKLFRMKSEISRDRIHDPQISNQIDAAVLIHKNNMQAYIPRVVRTSQLYDFTYHLPSYMYVHKAES